MVWITSIRPRTVINILKSIENPNEKPGMKEV